MEGAPDPESLPPSHSVSDKMDGNPDPEQEALHHNALAEDKFKVSNLKSALKHAKKAHRLSPNLDGLSTMITAFKILRAAEKSTGDAAPDWYKVLQVEPFCHINSIKKQYKKLALVLHPDKNSYLGCEEAFKLVGEGFRVFSDKIRRKEFDMKLRIKIQGERMGGGGEEEETFWTACSRCRLLHQFERRYLGHNLLCPNCKSSFVAVEVEGGSTKEEKEKEKEEEDGIRVWSKRLRSSVGSKWKASDDLGEVIGGLRSRNKMGSAGLNRKVVDCNKNGDLKGKDHGGDKARKGDVAAEWGSGRLRSVALRRRTSTVGEVLQRAKPKQVKSAEDTMTLAEMQLEAKRKASQVKMKEMMNVEEREKAKDKEKEKGKETNGALKTSRDLGIGRNEASDVSGDMGIVARRTSKNTRNSEADKSAGVAIERHRGYKQRDLGIMAVEDSDFYDFDKDRTERTFKKGQIWAIYDDDDGMPRYYGLIDEIVSVYPFELKFSWLDPQSNGDDGLMCWEKMGFHVSCGSFKVGKTTSTNLVNIFSHLVYFERAAREIYRIYPKKGSVWALYNEAAMDAEGINLSASDKRSYNIVVFLTTYSEMHGLSMAYLEKVEGFKTLFKRREIGSHAIRWLEKYDVRLFSHQIPARKLSGNEAPDRLKDCWELDPASLPSDLLTIVWGR
ncbi:putative DNAJ heat shock N-terminal domain-containing protein [Tripterygium wilfordii]|uniref:Putative DNAJ heat shock N-terminal domain-containing protein n=1 Tax=Tripterygium wilfordii TaxID=458696 RepID=A0A7J7C6I3_TRIWF|nr:uncharacterized protein LOC119987052 [Tripterygium wilfordii]KAF5729739.1 putative DNAJ heat shock N-terminal domain-containing protein [Tripterygium wilfordii]